MFEVRRATTDDLRSLAEMRMQLWPDAPLAGHVKDIIEILEGAGASFIAESKGTILAFIELSIKPYVNGCRTAPVAFVEGLWIEPESRRQGIGQGLIKAAEEWAVAEGCRELASDAQVNNSEAIAAHISWGFEETERVVYFRKRL